MDAENTLNSSNWSFKLTSGEHCKRTTKSRFGFLREAVKWKRRHYKKSNDCLTLFRDIGKGEQTNV